MIDVVFVAMFFVMVILGWSIFQVRYHRRYSLHKWTQLSLAGVLLVVVIAFEIDMRISGWESRAAGEIDGAADPAVWNALYLHLVFAITSALLWPVVVIRAWRQFPNPPAPCPHSRSHQFWARIAALDMLLTSITGWMFYFVAFV